MRIKYIIILLLIGGVQFCRGQYPPVSWRFNAQWIRPSEWILRISASMAPGWHIYSQFLADGGPMPTTIRLMESEAYIPLGNAIEEGEPVQFYDSIYETEITWFANDVTFLQRVRLNEFVPIVKGTIDYMACNEYLCIPDRMEFTVPLRASVEKH